MLDQKIPQYPVLQSKYTNFCIIDNVYVGVD